MSNTTPHLEPTLDAVSTIRDDGSRRFLFPADAPGRFLLARSWSAVALIAIYLLLPWVKVGGHPAVFLDLALRRFHLFGWTLASQDVWLLFFLIAGMGLLLFWVTAWLGRVWCGWACPQTVFLDHVYRRIERWIDGDALARRALAVAPWTPGKVARRIFKHVLYLLASALITHLFLAYFVSLPAVWGMMRAAPMENWSAFVFMAISTGILYFNFAWFREQLCIVVCPYGRLQSALIDEHSMVIGYDAKRGEPRGKLGTAGAGDCIGCNRCVQVCPTGIDIRQGLQIECIGCAACIDACDDVMTRIDKPRGLVRYDSMNGLAGRTTRWFRPRIALYGVIFAFGAGVAFWAFSAVKPASLGVTRMQGAPYLVDSSTVRNQFFVRLVNKRSEPATFVVQVDVPPGTRQIGMAELVQLPALGEESRPLVIAQNRTSYAGPFRFAVRVRSGGGEFELKREVEFIGPDAALLREDANETARKK